MSVITVQLRPARTVEVNLRKGGHGVGLTMSETPVSAVIGKMAVLKGDKGDPGSPGEGGSTVLQRVAGTALGGHRVVRSTGANTVGYASVDGAGQGDDTLGITLGAAEADAPINVQRSGVISFNGWAWQALRPVFLGLDGMLTQEEPQTGFYQVIGYAESPTSVVLNIESPIYFED